MRRFSLPPEWKPGEGCVLEGGRARYLSRVLRLAPGDRFPGLDAEGRSWLCELLEAGPDRLVIGVGPLPPGCAEPERLEDIRGGRAAAPPSPAAGSARLGPPEAARPPITLVQGLPKGSKMDLVVRQAAEAGVARVLPLRALRSVPEADSAARLERWRRIAREALQQSGSAVPTRVEAPIGLEALPGALGEGGPGRLRLFLDEEAPLAQSSLHGYLTEAPGEVVLCVGPEGGFAAEERRFLAGSGFSPFRLPCAVLRTETAALYAVAAVEIVLSERSSWIPSTS
ncbi:MAG TPA: RsmE family RNA methyltransferase [Spirochaetales bacterium]|nr:RsmE family RNA methyltransferase [Spirochaetales bacterium]HRY54292.1 RsmE family RNA methyltransferase [Spirochaetia bacterium]